MKFAWIAAEKASFRVADLCRGIGVSASGFYAWASRPESARAQRDRQLKVMIRTSFTANRQRYGSPRIHADLRDQEERVSRKRVIRLMQADGLRARPRKRFKCTTMSEHDQPLAANLLDRQFTADGPNRRWVGDTTEFVIGESGKLYLAAIVDLYSRFTSAGRSARSTTGTSRSATCGTGPRRRSSRGCRAVLVLKLPQLKVRAIVPAMRPAFSATDPDGQPRRRMMSQQPETGRSHVQRATEADQARRGAPPNVRHETMKRDGGKRE